ncbi:hypothetical protein ACET3X_005584 [Alternaria dauci]|uniref:E3 UFM1-protein ligase 1-like N-terminal domain-containing protein n=1 Tax=Alternaria dauci TaxID=48095 RepID=A0ABR3UN70_9PLEO
MFTESDVKNIFALFPPQQTSDFVPRLALSSSRHGFVTLQFVQAQFRSRVTKETQRISLSALASDLDIDRLLVHQLVRNHPKLCIFSANEESIIPIDERDAIGKEAVGLLSEGLLSKADFVAQHDVSPKSLHSLLSDQSDEVLETNGYFYTKSYADQAVETVKGIVKKALNDVQTVSIRPEDLPNNPPTWFILHTLEKAMQFEDLASRINVQENADSVTCTPKQYLETKRDTTVQDLQSGALAYLHLQKFGSEFPELFPTYQDVSSHFQQLSGVDVVESFAISQAWVSKLEQDCIRILEQEGCTLDVTEVIGARLPPSTVDTIATKAKDSIITHFSENSQGPKIVRVGPLILTDTRQDAALDELASYAKEDAQAQWRNLQHDPTQAEEIKFSRDRVKTMIPPSGLVQRLLLDQRPVEKTLEEHFWTTISSLETPNEEAFATYWTDRLLTRWSVYNTGLTTITDQKLHDQLAELLATYAHKELIPDTIAKARAQGLVLSRKTRKNIARLASILDAIKTSPPDTQSLSSALEKFNKKQNIAPPTPDSLSAAKQGMLADMLRRLQKQKASDGPVLFLTLVVVLYAKRYDGVVYATGKFAPKLLKVLKGGLGDEQVERVEAWKEAAKSNRLSAEDRRGMAEMAGAEEV